MSTKIIKETIEFLYKLIEEPNLSNSRKLENHLTSQGFQKNIFGRFNQKSSIDAASESVIEVLQNVYQTLLMLHLQHLVNLLVMLRAIALLPLELRLSDS